MPLTLVTAPASEPVSVAEARLHLRTEDDGEDGLVAALISAARHHAEEFTGRALVTQTWDLTRDAFPCDGADYIRLGKGRVQSVASVTYLDEAGESQTWDSSNYAVDTASEPGRLALAPDVFWPSTQSGRINAVTVRFVAGYGAAAAVPAAIKQAILLLVGHWYVNREAVVTGTIASDIPFAADMLLRQYRVMRLD